MNRGKVLLTSLFVKRLQAIRGCFTYSINGYGLWCTLDSQIERRILDSTASRHILNFGPSVRHGTPHPVRTPVASVSSLCRRSLHRRVRCPSHLDLLRRDTSIRFVCKGRRVCDTSSLLCLLSTFAKFLHKNDNPTQ